MSSIQQEEKKIRSGSPHGDKQHDSLAGPFKGPHTPPGRSPMTDPDSETGPQSEIHRRGFGRQSQERTPLINKDPRDQGDRRSRWENSRNANQNSSDRQPYSSQRGRGRGTASRWDPYGGSATPRDPGSNSNAGYNTNFNKWNSGPQNTPGGWGAFGSSPAGSGQNTRPGAFNARPSTPILLTPLFGARPVPSLLSNQPLMGTPRSSYSGRSNTDLSRGTRFQGPGQNSRFSSPNIGGSPAGGGHAIPVHVGAQNNRTGPRNRVSRFDSPSDAMKNNTSSADTASTANQNKSHMQEMDSIQEVYDIPALHKMFRKNPKQAFIFQIQEDYRKQQLARYEKAQSRNRTLPSRVEYSKKPHTPTYCKVCMSIPATICRFLAQGNLF